MVMDKQTLVNLLKDESLLDQYSFDQLNELSCQFPHFKMLKVLLAKKANIDNNNTIKDDVLHNIASSINDRHLLYKKLLKNNPEAYYQQVTEDYWETTSDASSIIGSKTEVLDKSLTSSFKEEEKEAEERKFSEEPVLGNQNQLNAEMEVLDKSMIHLFTKEKEEVEVEVEEFIDSKELDHKEEEIEEEEEYGKTEVIDISKLPNLTIPKPIYEENSESLNLEPQKKERLFTKRAAFQDLDEFNNEIQEKSISENLSIKTNMKGEDVVKRIKEEKEAPIEEIMPKKLFPDTKENASPDNLKKEEDTNILSEDLASKEIEKDLIELQKEREELAKNADSAKDSNKNQIETAVMNDLEELKKSLNRKQKLFTNQQNNSSLEGNDELIENIKEKLDKFKKNKPNTSRRQKSTNKEEHFKEMLSKDTENISEIERFMNESYRDVKQDKNYNANEKAKQSSSYDFDNSTETLAKVYEKQGDIEKAVKVYKDLCLKYPKKSSYFADRIDMLKKMK